MEFFHKIDVALLERMNVWAGTSPFLDAAIVFFAIYLWYVVMAALALMVFFSFLPHLRHHLKRNAEVFISAFISAFAARFLFTEFIRFFYNRPRPFGVLESVRQLISHAGGGSFPSGHAALAFAVATSVSFYYPKTSILFFLAALSIGFGRIAAGLHWPSDILGGAVVGIISAWLVRMLAKKFYQK